MADFVLRAASPLPARACFDQLVDWDAHSAAIPFTKLQYDGEPRVGQRFVARTGWGPIGFDDVMVVDALQPPKGDQPGDEPGAVAISKHGRDVGGTVGWTVTPTATGSDVTWTQHLVIGWLPRWIDPLVGAIGRRAYGLGLQRLVK
jgi:hypothetical protein